MKLRDVTLLRFAITMMFTIATGISIYMVFRAISEKMVQKKQPKPGDYFV